MKSNVPSHLKFQLGKETVPLFIRKQFLQGKDTPDRETEFHKRDHPAAICGQWNSSIHIGDQFPAIWQLHIKDQCEAIWEATCEYMYTNTDIYSGS